MTTSRFLGTPAKARLRERIGQTFRDAAAIGDSLDDQEPPDVVTDWLTRLELLVGVPFQYLVPDERMLPPESIRFFSVDFTWVDALFDGAFSIGRDLTSAAGAAGMNLDRAIRPGLRNHVHGRLSTVRAKLLGVPPAGEAVHTVTGFLLRSQIVSAYPTMGVNAWAKDATENDPPLPLLRLETLGAKSDTLIGLVKGEAYRIDIHEAAEHLHYAIDKYTPSPLAAQKEIHTFTVSGGVVTINENAQPLDVTPSLRAVSPRTFNVTALAAQIAGLNTVPSLDSAEMGFEMSEGVGMVSFLRRNS
jgi:hypothetical protein